MGRRDTQTGDLLSWTPAPVAVGYAPDVAGRGALGNQVARLVSRALRDARDDRNLSRSAVAEAMAEYLGRSVTAAMLDQWSSEANDDRRIPLDAFAALIHATGAHELLGFLPELFGFVAMPARYAAVIELHELEEQEKRLAAHKAALQTKLRASR